MWKCHRLCKATLDDDVFSEEMKKIPLPTSTHSVSILWLCCVSRYGMRICIIIPVLTMITYQHYIRTFAHA